MCDIGVMVMKWYTRAWVNSELDDEADGRLQAEYLTHIRALMPRLPDALKIFAGEPDQLGYLSLHDGVVEWWTLDGDRSFTVQIVCGDNQLGYRRIVIQYRGAIELIGTDVAELSSWLDNCKTELYYDEIDICDDGRFEHRHMLLPGGEFPTGEFGVRFSEASVISAPLKDGLVRLNMLRRQPKRPTGQAK